MSNVAGTDASIELFWRGYKEAPGLPDKARVLEIGCQEYDWRTKATRVCPGWDIYGLDWRAQPSGRTMRGDVMDRNHFAGWSFDVIVAVSTIEHVGLGHYTDPIHEWGDQVAMRNIWHWLKPGGSLWIDVPYTEERYHVQGTKHRVYNEAALEIRLELPRWDTVWSGREWIVKGFWLQKAV